MPSTPSTEDLLDLVVGQRQSSFGFEVLDASLNVIGSVSPASDAPVTVDVNATRAIKRTLSGLVLASQADADAIDPFGDRIRPVMTLENGESFELGVLLWADLSRSPDTPGHYAEGALVDQTLIVDQPIARGVVLSVGTNLGTFLEGLLATSGVPAYRVTSTPQTAPSPGLAWPVGTSLLTIINTVSRLCGFYDLYFDNAGFAVLKPVPDLATEDPGVVYAAGGRIYSSTMVESDDTLTAPNRFLVVDTSAGNQAPVAAVYEVPASAPHSIANRGFAVTEVVEVQGLSSSSAAAAYAAALGQTRSAAYAHLSFAGAPDPRHDVHTVVEVDGVRWHELGWKLQLQEGAPMTHDLRRVYT